MSLLDLFFSVRPERVRGHPDDPLPCCILMGYLLLALIDCPNLNRTHGTGSKATDAKPSSELAQPIPRRSYICIVNKGNAPASPYRARLFALAADATVVP